MKVLKRSDIIVLVIAILSQVILGLWAKNDIIAYISGVAGIISVVLCSQKKVSMYIFGFIQLGTYLVLTLREHVWAEFVENIFYAITMVVGVVIWIKNYNKDKFEVNAKELSFNMKALCGGLLLIGTLATAFVLDTFTNDPYPWLDAISTVPAFIAEILMMFRFKEQWTFWLIVDLTSIVLWAMIGNPFMIVQYVLWSANCIYGMYKWKEQ